MPRRLLNVPHIPQRDNADCLAACAAMLLAAAGVAYRYERVLTTLQIADWGAPRSNLVRLPYLYPDVVVVQAQGNLIDLIARIDAGFAPMLFLYTAELPYWTSAAFHAVVLIGYDDEHFYLNDPAFDHAPQIVRHGDLELAWMETDAYYALIQRTR